MTGTERASIFAALKSHLITQVIAVVCFVIVPVVITLMAPLSTIEFQRSGTRNNVIVHRYALIFVPWRTERIDNVTQIRADVTSQFRRHLREQKKEQGRNDQPGHRASRHYWHPR